MEEWFYQQDWFAIFRFPNIYLLLQSIYQATRAYVMLRRCVETGALGPGDKKVSFAQSRFPGRTVVPINAYFNLFMEIIYMVWPLSITDIWMIIKGDQYFCYTFRSHINHCCSMEKLCLFIHISVTALFGSWQIGIRRCCTSNTRLLLIIDWTL